MSLLATVHGRGLLSARPAAAAANEGYIYYSTDTGALTRSNGSSWDAYAPTSLVNPMTTTGDIIYSSDGSGTPARLAGGTAGKFLTATGAAAPAWGQGPLTTTGDLLLGATGGTPTRLAAVAAGQVLKSAGVGAAPVWGYAAFHGCRVYNNANLSRNSADFSTLLTFNTERYDTDAYHDTSSATGRIVIPTGLGGYHGVGGHVEWASNATGIRYLYLTINGTVIAADTRAAVNGETTRLSVYTEINTSVADYFELLAVQTSGGALNVLATSAYSPEFFARFLGA